MKLLKYILFSLITVIGLSNCEETIDLELNRAVDKVVISATLTDHLGNHPVKLNRLASFYTTGQYPTISNATVVIKDDEGNTYNYAESQTDPGIYLSENEFEGIVGRTYTLTVNVNGEIFEASDKMNPVTPIDSITWEIDEDIKEELEEEGDDDEERYYDILFYTTEPQDTEDYYLFKFYKNDVLYNGDGNNEVYYSDDEFIQENVDGLKAGIYYIKGEKATFEMYSISREAYFFFFSLEVNLDNDGGLFSSAPANVESNFSNGGIGLFQVSAMVSKSLIVGQ